MSGDKDLGPIGIRPEVNMLSVLRHLNYKPWFAIAEFIDNAIQSYIANQAALIELNGADYRLRIEVQIDPTEPGRIVIADNAAGISTKDFPRAFRTAQIPIDRSGLSEFGMGMKSAACWFSQAWDVRTKALNEEIERTISFDIRHIIGNKIENLETTYREVKFPAPYTVVTLRGLHHIPQGRTIGKIKEHLASIYRIFLSDGRLVLKFNGEELAYKKVAVLNAIPYTAPGIHDPDAKPVEWIKDINLDFGKGQQVKGFAALREVGSTPYAGFALFRRDRLIEGSHDETYRPSLIFKQTNSYQYQRLYGELHIEGFEVSHTKDGFRWEEYEDIFLECLKKNLESGPLDLLAQAENYRALPSKKNIGKHVIAATDSVIEHIQNEVAPLLIEVREHPASPEEVPPSLPASELNVSDRTVSVDDGVNTWIITLRTTLDPIVEDWVAISRENAIEEVGGRVRRLGIELSLAHPFSTDFLGANNENVELFLRIASAISISLVLSEDVTGEPPESVLFHFNYLLRGALSQAAIIPKGSQNEVN